MVALGWLSAALLLLGYSGHATAVGDAGGGGCRSRPLGLLSGEIKDWQLAASSVVR